MVTRCPPSTCGSDRIGTRPGRHRPLNRRPRMLVWVEQIEGTPQCPLQFRTRGRGPNHTLVPLDQIMDERYSVYLRNITHNLIEHNGA